MVEDARGRLTAVAFADLPFAPARAYVIDRLPAGARRGGHACRTQHRFLVGLADEVMVTLDDGRTSCMVELGQGATLHVSPGTWLELEARTDGAAVLVLADGEYDPGDYVADRAMLPIAVETPTQTASA